MRRALQLFLFFVAMFCISCHQTKDLKYHVIQFDESKLDPRFLQSYIDSVRNRDLAVPDSIKDMFGAVNELYDHERLIRFRNPDEWYLVDLQFYPFGIAFIYNKDISMRPINKKSFLGGGQYDRIKMRFRDEILKSAEEYGSTKHLPDSVIYMKGLNP